MIEDKSRRQSFEEWWYKTIYPAILKDHELNEYAQDSVKCIAESAFLAGGRIAIESLVYKMTQNLNHRFAILPCPG